MARSAAISLGMIPVPPASIVVDGMALNVGLGSVMASNAATTDAVTDAAVVTAA